MTPAEEDALVLNAAEVVANAHANFAYPSAAIEAAIRLAIRAAYAKGREDATAQERERCARVCEKIGYGDEYWTKSVGDVCAEAIRGMK